MKCLKPTSRPTRVPGDLLHLALDRFAVEGGQRVAVAADDHLAFLQHDDLAGVLQHRRDVGGDEHLALADPDDQRRGAVAREDQPVGRLRRDDAQRERAAHLRQRAPQRGDEVALVVRLDEVREHFGVGLAAEDVAFAEQLRAQRRVVLDDAVVDDGDPAAAVHVRVRVGVGGAAVGRPARVPDAVVPCSASPFRSRSASRWRASLRPSTRTRRPPSSMTAIPAES
jgi:hypothetical protein